MRKTISGSLARESPEWWREDKKRQRTQCRVKAEKRETFIAVVATIFRFSTSTKKTRAPLINLFINFLPLFLLLLRFLSLRSHCFRGCEKFLLIEIKRVVAKTLRQFKLQRRASYITEKRDLILPHRKRAFGVENLCRPPTLALISHFFALPGDSLLPQTAAERKWNFCFLCCRRPSYQIVFLAETWFSRKKFSTHMI